MPDIDDKSLRATRDTVVMFVDIIGASEVSNYKKPAEYSEFVTDFQNLFISVCKEYIATLYKKKDKNYQFSARGDEGLLMIYPQNIPEENLSNEVDTAIIIALALKRRWICKGQNKARIQTDGLLPIDLGIGIHVGKTYLKKLKKGEYQEELNPSGIRPEGYSINLTKRIESESRSGKYTRIFISEAARGELNYLSDEQTYVFDEQQRIQPKGISRDIRVFEVKHHFLPTDWSDLSERNRRRKSKVDPNEADINVLRDAYKMNPTNMWLAEECIRTSILKRYDGVKAEDRSDDKLIKIFQEAKQIADDLAHGDQRDAAILFIQGFIEGECLNFKLERKRYKEAEAFTSQVSTVHWYEALSFSNEVFYAIKKNNDKTYHELIDVPSYNKEDLQGMIKEAENKFMEAKERSPRSAWIPYDYGRELVRWNETPAKLREGVRQISIAFKRLPDEVAETAAPDKYLNRVRNRDEIKKILAHAKKLNKS